MIVTACAPPHPLETIYYTQGYSESQIIASWLCDVNIKMYTF